MLSLSSWSLLFNGQSTTSFSKKSTLPDQHNEISELFSMFFKIDQSIRNVKKVSTYQFSRVREHGVTVEDVPGGVVDGGGDVHLQLVHGGLQDR